MTLWLGVAALVAFVASAAFPLHRLLVRLPERWRPRFRAAAWLRAHRALGALAFLLALLHVRPPRGGAGLLLLGLLVACFLSAGLVEALVKRVPQLLSERLRASEPAARVSDRVRELAAAARALPLAPPARAAFEAQLAPRLERPAWRLRPPRFEDAAALLAPLAVAAGADDVAREALEDLRLLVQEKLELDAQRGLEGALAAARALHAALGGALIGLAAVHGASFWFY
ncbi:MAG: hypothetical protein KJ067_14855 [Vicinamibacteria bacterium]|nr:hypothetical protein [Vicinamibacteria bacterium]